MSGETTNGKALRLPTFIHVGPPRTGTTWLHEVTKGHIGLPSKKETGFFDGRYELGIDWYCSLFGEYPADVPGGEFCPSYFSNTVARERIKELIPDCKIIVTFREPAARLYSMYRLNRLSRNPVKDTFKGYWRFPINCGADLCNYATNLKRWQAAFGKQRVLVLFYEDLSANPQTYLDTVCDFIGARRIPLDRSKIGRCQGTFGACRCPLHQTCLPRGRGHRLGSSPWRASVDRTRPAQPAVEDHAPAIRRGVPAAGQESADEVRAMLLPGNRGP